MNRCNFSDDEQYPPPPSGPSGPAHPLSETKHPVSILMELAQRSLISHPDFTIVILTDPSSPLPHRFRAMCRLSYKEYSLEATAEDSTKKGAKTKVAQVMLEKKLIPLVDRTSPPDIVKIFAISKSPTAHFYGFDNVDAQKKVPIPTPTPEAPVQIDCISKIQDALNDLHTICRKQMTNDPEFMEIGTTSSYKVICRVQWSDFILETEGICEEREEAKVIAAQTMGVELQKDLHTLLSQAAQGSGLLTILKLLPQQHSVADTTETSSKHVICSHTEDRCDSTTVKEDSCPETEKSASDTLLLVKAKMEVVEEKVAPDKINSREQNPSALETVAAFENSVPILVKTENKTTEQMNTEKISSSTMSFSGYSSVPFFRSPPGNMEKCEPSNWSPSRPQYPSTFSPSPSPWEPGCQPFSTFQMTPALFQKTPPPTHPHFNNFNFPFQPPPPPSPPHQLRSPNRQGVRFGSNVRTRGIGNHRYHPYMNSPPTRPTLQQLQDKVILLERERMFAQRTPEDWQRRLDEIQHDVEFGGGESKEEQT